MAKVASYRDLIAWQKSMHLAEACHGLALRLPGEERFVLGAQLRRSAMSVPANIAEGQRRTTAGFRQFLRVALGSLAELETQLELAVRFGYLPRAEVDQAIGQAEEVARIIRGLMTSLPAGEKH